MSEQKKSAAQSVLETIKKENVAPVPRWRFIARNIFVWVSGLIFLIAGAVSVSLIIFAISGSAWQLRGVLGHTTFGHIFIIMPFIWVIAFVLFLFGADYAMRHTKKGYRYPLWVIVAALLVGSVVGGAVLHAAKVDQFTDETFGRYMPRYKTVEKRRAILMHDPQEGRIMGVITGIDGHNISVQNHIFNEQWTVYAEGYDAGLVHGMKVLIVGERGDNGEMHVQEIIILPYGQGRHMREGQSVGSGQHVGERAVFEKEKEQHREEHQKGSVRGMHRERK